MYLAGVSTLRWVGALLGGGTLACAAVAAHAVREEQSSSAATHYDVARPSGDPWFESARSLDLRTPKGVVFRGWLRPSTNGAAVVLVDGSAADRRQLLPEAHILSNAGYGVLVFDRPGNGESGGLRGRGDEADFLRIAVDTLASEPGPPSGGIGGYGFSSGAAFLAEAAARDTRLASVVLVGCYDDAHDYIVHFHGRDPVSGFSRLVWSEWAGFVLPQPVVRVPAIAPRALFLIAGDEDPVVPPDLSKRVYSAATEPKELWVVHGAGHGDYEKVAGEEFSRRLVGFFDRTLLGRSGSR
jgi:alpha-beta hydrolase superfamily lysophospholipase